MSYEYAVVQSISFPDRPTSNPTHIVTITQNAILCGYWPFERPNDAFRYVDRYSTFLMLETMAESTSF